MRLFSKAAILTAAGAVLLGSSVGLSNAGAVFGASQGHAGDAQVAPAKKSCDTSGVCLTETNKGSGGAISAANDSITLATIDATNGTSTAVYAHSQEGAAIIGLGTSNAGVVAESNASVATTALAALQVEGGNQNTWLLWAYNEPKQSECYIDPSADLTCSGTINVMHRDSSGQRMLSYASESASETIEDVGTARISGGIANVRIDPSFASVMDHKWYYVFLTPLGDTRGLYVNIKTPSAFQVRETERGRDSLDFDYRIVAHPLDGKSGRLPAAPAMPMPRR